MAKWLPSIKGKLETVPNGVHIPPWAARKAVSGTGGPPVILFVGRLRHAKGLDVLLHALAGLPVAGYQLRIVGDGELRKSLENLAVTLGVRDKIVFLGFRSDVTALMSSADCLVLPSRWEGMPNVVLEAMAIGLPVVATRVGGIPEVIEHGLTGWLVPPEDPLALAAALATALADRRRARCIAESARQRVARDYSIEAMSERTLEVYTQVLGA